MKRCPAFYVVHELVRIYVLCSWFGREFFQAGRHQKIGKGHECLTSGDRWRFDVTCWVKKKK